MTRPAVIPGGQALLCHVPVVAQPCEGALARWLPGLLAVGAALVLALEVGR